MTRMSRPDPSAPPSSAPQTPQAATQPLRFVQRLGKMLLWVVGTGVGLVAAGALAIWLWAATPGSLAQALGWAQSWLRHQDAPIGQLDTQGTEGSLRSGGRIATLTWTQDGLRVQAQGVQLDWGDALFTELMRGSGVRLDRLTIERLSVRDVRPSTPTEPMQSLVLPLPVSLAFGVNQFELSGNSAFTFSQLKGDYQYGPTGAQGDAPALPAGQGVTDAHQLRIDSLQIADGRYEGKLSLGAQAPMPLAMALLGEIKAQVPDGAGVQLSLHAQGHGTLSGAQAAIDVQAEAQGMPNTPKAQASTLALSARVMPWASQPLISAKANAQSLNLAALWPSAPVTDLSGTLQAQPEADNSWRAELQLRNALTRPADQNGLPVQNLQARVTQQGDRWTIEQLQAQLGGGELQGKGVFNLSSQEGASAVTDWQGELQANGIRPALLWSTLAEGALNASASASAAPDTSLPGAVNLNARVQPAAQQPKGTALKGLRLEDFSLQGAWRPHAAANPPSPSMGELSLARAHLAIAGAEINAQGTFDTERLSYDGKLGLTLPGATFGAQGLLAHGTGKGQGELTIADAKKLLDWVRGLRDLPFVGDSIKSALAGQEALRLDGSASAQLRWNGGLGALGFPSPPATTTTSPGLPQIQVALKVPKLMVQTGQAAAPVTLVDIALTTDGPFSALQLSASGGALVPGWTVGLNAKGQASLDAPSPGKGLLNLSQLALQLQAETPKDSPPQPANGWRLSNAQPLQMRWSHNAGQGTAIDGRKGLMNFTPLSPALSTQLAGPLTIEWQSLVWQANALQTQGRLQGLTIPWIEALAAIGQPNSLNTPMAQTGVSGDLVLDGAWNVNVPADALTTLDLSATLQRRSGDLRWESNPGSAAKGGAPTPQERINAGVRDARVSLVVKDRQARASLRWDTERLGQASAEFNTTLASGSGEAPLLDRWWPASSPLSGSAQASLPQVGVWSMFAPPGWRMRGTLNARAAISGTRGQPAWSGSIEANELALRSVVDGFAFTNGQLRASLAGDRLSVERFSLQGPGGKETGGTLEASGQAQWRAMPGSALRQPLITLQAKADHLRVSNRVDRRVALSGDVSAELNGPQLQLRGQLKVDSAQIILPDELAPSLGKDVIVRSTRTLPTESSAETVKPDVQVSVDLGPKFQLRGQGIDTRLEGQLTVRATPALPAPRAFGEVRAVNGTYKAYGQQLNIETGVLRFTGPYDDPALDVLAVRKLPENTEQRVGVQISGNAQAPRVALYSDPGLTDGETLAWLVLGRPASAAGAQAFVLQQAARQLLARGGAPSDGALAKTLGVDEVGFADAGGNADGTGTETALTVGKRLSDKLYLSYEQSLSGAMSTVSILYDLSKSLTLRARAGTENAIDLIFTHRYE
jgi:translocation and assembly module TamB